jgi:Cu2+-exporting ATPase
MNTVDHTVWARPQLAAQVLRRRRDGRAEVALRVPGLDNPRRVLNLEQALNALPGAARMSADVAARRVRVDFDDGAAPLPRLLDACAAAGCAAEPLAVDRLDARRQEYADSLRRLLVAGLFSMQAMMFALVLYLGGVDAVDAPTLQLFRWLGLVAATPVVGYAALPFYRHALRDLHRGHGGIDVPVALAVLLIYGAGAVSALRGSGEVYFDSVSMFVFALLLGRHLELRARHRHRALGEAAADAVPLVAERRRDDGSLECVAVAELAPGDRVHVAEGGVVPADGVLDNAGVRIDESLLTGESRPCVRRRGERVAAGSVVLQGPLDLRVEGDVQVGTLVRLATLAGQPARDDDDAGESAVARAFVWRVLVLVLATAAFWLWRDPARAFDTTVAVLVVACPCAFGLAAPAAMARAMAVLARCGVLVTRPSALLSLARGNRVLFDKTGTLTEPAVRADAIGPQRGLARDEALRLAAALARESSHPLARAVARLCNGATLPAAQHVEVLAGGGIRAEIDGRRLRLGRAGFAVPGDDDALWLADDDGALARLPVEESVRIEATAAIAALRSLGLRPVIASGDGESRVRAVAVQLGIGDWHARQSPGDKRDLVHAWQARGDTVLAVGDGGNDAPALAAADVSAALAGGAELAQEHADLLLVRGLDGLASACELARGARDTMRQNRRWSLAYNLAAIPFAAAGLLPPWLAALGMSLSSLAVVINTWRIGRPRAAAIPRLRERAA